MKKLPELPKIAEFMENRNTTKGKVYQGIPRYTKQQKKGKNKLLIAIILLLIVTSIGAFYEFYPVIAKETKNILNKQIPSNTQDFMKQMEENNLVIFKSENTEILDKNIDATVLIVDNGNNLELFVYADNIEKIAIIDMLREAIND